MSALAPKARHSASGFLPSCQICADFPYPPTVEHPISGLIDKACRDLGYSSFPVPRAVLSRPALGRNSCLYTNYCGSYGCSSGAKGSSRAALLKQAVRTGHCRIRPHSMVSRILSDQKGRIEAVEYIDGDGARKRLDAEIYVVACQAIESARLLLMSTGPRYPDGLANGNGQVGRRAARPWRNLDVIKNADWIIDLGPEGGDAGGQVVCEGEITTIKKCKQSYTGQYLNKY